MSTTETDEQIADRIWDENPPRDWKFNNESPALRNAAIRLVEKSIAIGRERRGLEDVDEFDRLTKERDAALAEVEKGKFNRPNPPTDYQALAKEAMAQAWPERVWYNLPEIERAERTRFARAIVRIAWQWEYREQDKPSVMDLEKIAYLAWRSTSTLGGEEHQWEKIWETKGPDLKRYAEEAIRLAGLAPDPDLVSVSRKKAVEWIKTFSLGEMKCTPRDAVRLFAMDMGLPTETPKPSNEERIKELVEQLAARIIEDGRLVSETTGSMVRQAIKKGMEVGREELTLDSRNLVK